MLADEILILELCAVDRFPARTLRRIGHRSAQPARRGILVLKRELTDPAQKELVVTSYY